MFHTKKTTLLIPLKQSNLNGDSLVFNNTYKKDPLILVLTTVGPKLGVKLGLKLGVTLVKSSLNQLVSNLNATEVT